MLDRDLADSPLACCLPEEIRESLNDLLREVVSPFIDHGERGRAFSGIDAVISEYEREYGAPRPLDAADASKSLFEFIRSIYGDTRLPDDVRRRAAAAGIASGDPLFGESYQYYADYLTGVTRACIHADAREMQNDLGIRNRRDKSDAARAKSKERASGTNRHRRFKRVSAGRLFTLLPGL